MGTRQVQVDSKGLGREGEALAARFLEGRGFRILEKNYRCRWGEIDLIAKKGDRILFVEVKSRRATDSVSLLELVSYKKQVHLSRTAQYFLGRSRRTMSGEFALLTVDFSGASPVCELIDDIFPLAWGY